MTAILTIGFPVYNGVQYLRESLDSLLSQTFEDFTIIISDNGSTDATQEICASYAAQDGRIQYIREEINRGAIWNYNRIFKIAESKYFKWASYDDLCAPTFFETCINILEQDSEVVLAYPCTTVIDENGDFMSLYPDDLNLYHLGLCERYQKYLRLYRSPRSCNPIFGIIRSETLAQTPLFGNFVSADQILLGELALRGKFYEVPECLFFRRDHQQASIRAHESDRDLLAWIDPTKNGKIILPRWRWLWEYFLSIIRVHMTYREKTMCLLRLSRWAYWNVPGLFKDLIKVGLWPFLDSLYKAKKWYQLKTAA